jgi:hypothetical protein
MLTVPDPTPSDRIRIARAQSRNSLIYCGLGIAYLVLEFFGDRAGRPALFHNPLLFGLWWLMFGSWDIIKNRRVIREAEKSLSP